MSRKKNLKSQGNESKSGSSPSKSSQGLERIDSHEANKSRQSGDNREDKPREKIRPASKIVISISLLLLLTIGFTSVLAGLELTHPFAGAQSQSQALQAYHLISIRGDSGFTADQGVTGGTGTTSDPYIIQGWSIDLSPYQSVSFPPRAGISIERTTAQFVIRNVKVSGGLSASASIGVTTPCYFTQNGIPGIMLSHVQNGIVQNSESDQNSVGVYLDHSASNSVTNNVLQGNECGVYLLVSNYNTISLNTATGLCCNPLTWENGYSFDLFGSSNNTLSYNKAYNAGIGFTVSAIRTTNILDFRATGNTLANNTASYSQADGFFLNETDHNIVESNTAKNTIGGYGVDGVGFNFQYTIGEVVIGNFAIDNSWGGFFLQASTENLLVSNTATGGTIPGIPAYGAGFSFLKSDRNTLMSNIAYGNLKGFDITTSSFHNRLTKNISHDNGIGFVMEIGSDLNVFDFNQVYKNTEGFSVDTASAGNGGSGETFVYNTVRDNAQGFSVGTSENQTILGNIVFDNNIPFTANGVIIMDSTGIFLQGVTKSKIASNILFNNPVGIETSAGILQGGGNSIYNNFLSNPENTNVDPNVPDNWNVTKRQGTNVIGGPFIGGNFWSDFTGIDKNNDGIGDSSYYPETCVAGLCNRWGQTLGINIDHLPLVFPPPSGTMADFTLVSQTNLTVDEGSNSTFVLAFLSRNFFSGTLSMSATISPSNANGPLIAFKPSTINLPAGGTVAAAANVTNTMIPGTYNIVITATTGSTSHTISVQFTIAAVSKPSPTITTVVCDPPTVALNHATSCTATVVHIDLAATISPTGTVTFNPGGTCTLAGTGASATCSVTITPTTSGALQISATYAGSPTDARSSGGTIITVAIETTATTITCTPSTVSIRQASTCTAIVTDTSQGTTSTPTGTVTWTTTSSGTFGSMTCNLAGTHVSASCYVAYAPTTTGSHQITGSYGGDTIHPNSFGTFTISVVARATVTVVACTPSIPVIGQATSCAAMVADNAPGTISTPTGTVTFTVTGGSGTFSSNSCAIATGQCTVTFTPTSATATITADYGGDTTHATSSGALTITMSKRSTSTVVTCVSSVVIGQGSTCSATVADTSLGPSSTPTGIVNFGSSGAVGTFSSTACTLALGTCTVTFTPSASGGTTVNGNYAGDTSHGTSAGSSTITATVRSTATVITCSPSSVNTGSATSCTATVTDTSTSRAATPTGAVSFTPSGTCTLSGTGASATCSVSVVPSAVGSLSVTASYAGDSTHGTSMGTTILTVLSPAFDFQLSTPMPAGLTVALGRTSSTSSIIATLASGTATAVTFSVTSALPAGVTASFINSPCSPSCAVTVSFSATATATLGTTIVTIQAAGGGMSHTQSLSLTVQPQPASFDYSLSVMPNAASIVVGASTSFTITATLTSGTSQTVTLIGSISPQPMVCQLVYGVSPCGNVTISPLSITPTFAGAMSTVTISSTNIVPPGTYTLTITGSPSGVSSHSTVFTLTVRGAGPVSTSVGVVCSPVSAIIGSSSSCTATVTGSSPTGLVTFSVVGSNGGMAALAASSCTLSSGSCSVSLRGLSEGTATVTAVYSGDTNNLGSSGSSSLTVQKPANAVASNSASSTLLGGKVSTDQTSVTGVSVNITGSTAADGTSVIMVTQHLSSLSAGVGKISLNNAAYYDVLVSGVSNGNAIVCITDQSAGSTTAMMYWDGKGWVNASGVSVVGSQVCGTIPVSALTGTNLVVGDVTLTPFTLTLLVIIGSIVIAAVATAVLVLSRRGKTTRNPMQ